MARPGKSDWRGCRSKRRYGNDNEADAAARKATRHSGVPITTYWCGSCQGFHLTRQTQRRGPLPPVPKERTVTGDIHPADIHNAVTNPGADARALAHDPVREALERSAWVAFMAAALGAKDFVKVGECAKTIQVDPAEAAKAADAALDEFRARWCKP